MKKSAVILFFVVTVSAWRNGKCDSPCSSEQDVCTDRCAKSDPQFKHTAAAAVEVSSMTIAMAGCTMRAE